MLISSKAPAKVTHKSKHHIIFCSFFSWDFLFLIELWEHFICSGYYMCCRYFLPICHVSSVFACGNFYGQKLHCCYVIWNLAINLFCGFCLFLPPCLRSYNYVLHGLYFSFNPSWTGAQMSALDRSTTSDKRFHWEAWHRKAPACVPLPQRLLQLSPRAAFRGGGLDQGLGSFPLSASFH